MPVQDSGRISFTVTGSHYEEIFEKARTIALEFFQGVDDLHRSLRVSFDSITPLVVAGAGASVASWEGNAVAWVKIQQPDEEAS